MTIYEDQIQSLILAQLEGRTLKLRIPNYNRRRFIESVRKMGYEYDPINNTIIFDSK